jgi:hypothetical protein
LRCWMNPYPARGWGISSLKLHFLFFGFSHVAF